MRAAALRFELHIPLAQSLKEKRAVLRPVIEGLRNRMSVSVAEVGHQDSWQRAVIGVAVVATDGRHLEALLERVRRYVDEQPQAELCNWEIRYLEEAE
jgi:uncharacterized protein YlxP (DUF503 family)